MQKNLQKREQAVLELIDTEFAYVKNLEIIINIFLKPIRQKGLLTKPEITMIFSNIETIHSINQSFCNEFDQEIKTNQNYNTNSYLVGKIFKSYASQFRMYLFYCRYHNEANQTFKSALEKKEFAEFHDLATKKKECQKKTLQDFLIEPIQRLMKYPLLFQEIIKYTPQDHPDYQDLIDANKSILSIIDFINDEKRLLENDEKIISIKNSIDGLPNNFQLLNKKRTFLMEGLISKISHGRSQERYFFLFSDLLIYTKRSLYKKNKYQFKDKVPLSVILPKAIIDPIQGETSFELIRSDKKSKYTLCFKTKEMKDKWFEAIQKNSLEQIEKKAEQTEFNKITPKKRLAKGKSARDFRVVSMHQLDRSFSESNYEENPFKNLTKENNSENQIKSKLQTSLFDSKNNEQKNPSKVQNPNTIDLIQKQDTFKTSAHFISLISIQRKIASKKIGDFTIVHPDRQLIFEGDLKKLDKNKRKCLRHFWLFNDGILYAQKIKFKSNFEFKGFIPISLIQVRLVPDTNSYKNAFSIYRGDKQKRMILCTSSPKEQESWISLIKSQMQEKVGNQIFSTESISSNQEIKNQENQNQNQNQENYYDENYYDENQNQTYYDENFDYDYQNQKSNKKSNKKSKSK
ncbi:faciogenital dysplasia protein [Anaeramoeba ignava]|uniref:Faciogenital dysplasia protein n=1 Tax=Anaeramoeba ignava TaxID=1746090 RepID=A0A9Q0R9N1_ANAIG|nr:faciogenital dysplasia protein [Anaeramoeba ignava]